MDEFSRRQLRPTDDIDCIVPAISTKTQWWKLEARLRQRGWSPDPTGPICRYISPGGVVVDLMTAEPEILGFSGTWYPQAVAQAERRVLATGRSVLVPTPALLLACKLEAWEERGQQDLWASKDFEDIVALLDGCRELEDSVARADTLLRAYIQRACARIAGDDTLLDVATAQLPVGGDRTAREERMMTRLARLASKVHGSYSKL